MTVPGTPTLPVPVVLASAEAGTVEHRAALASLPAHFRLVAGRRAPVTLVSGRAADWPEQVRAAMDRPITAGVLLSEPALAAPADVDRLVRAAGQRGVVVLVSSPFVTSTLEAVAEETRRDAAAAAAIDGLIVSGDRGSAPLHRALLHQLAMLRTVAGRVAAPEVRHTGAGSYVVTGVVGSVPVVLAGARSDREGSVLRLDLVGQARRWEIVCDGGPPAAPTSATVSDRSGRHTRHRHYEGGDRAGWRRLHDALCGRRPPPADLLELGRDLEAVSATLGMPG